MLIHQNLLGSHDVTARMVFRIERAGARPAPLLKGNFPNAMFRLHPQLKALHGEAFRFGSIPLRFQALFFQRINGHGLEIPL